MDMVIYYQNLPPPSWAATIFFAFSGKNIKTPDIYLQILEQDANQGKIKISSYVYMLLNLLLAEHAFSMWSLLFTLLL